MGADLEGRMERAERLVAHLFDSHDYVLDELRTLAKSQVSLSDELQRTAKTLQAAFLQMAAEMAKRSAEIDERFSETTDKLNALIALMDQHLNDHRTGLTN